MSKDPAFLFYSQDWIVGTQTLTMVERGQYITILAQMHQQGRLNEETIKILVGNVSEKLRSKFHIDKKGLWYNIKLETEAAKRAKFTESRRNNGKNGGRPKKALAKPLGYDMDNHIENENEIENRNIIPPSLESVRRYCISRNNSVNYKKWFDFYQSKNWMVGKNKMKDWQAAVRTWEDDVKKVEPDKQIVCL